MAKIEDGVICQVCMVVEDIETTAANYAKLFGIPMPEIVYVPKGDEVPVFYRGKPISPNVKFCYFKIGDSITIELTEPGDEPSGWKEFYDQHGQGVHHIGVMVKDRDEAMTALKDLGVDEVHAGYYPTASYTFVDSMKQLGVNLNIKHDGEDNSDKLKK